MHSLFVTAAAATVRSPGRAEPGGLGEEFLDVAGLNWLSGPAKRGKAYAQDGSILSLEWAAGLVAAQVAGSGSDYLTVISGVPSLDDTEPAVMRLVAVCSCPYGSRSRDWCKHAVAVSYAIAAILDGAVDDQTGQLPFAAAIELDQAQLNEAVERLSSDWDWGSFDPEAAFIAARRWLELPPIVSFPGSVGSIDGCA